MSPINLPREPFGEESELEAERQLDETTSDWPDEPDDEDELTDGVLQELLDDSLGDDWEIEAFESESDFYDELRERHEDDEPL